MKNAIFVSVVLFVGFLNPMYAQNSTKAEQQVDAIFLEMVALAETLDYDALSAGVDDKHGAGFVVNGVFYAKYETLINTLKQSAQGVVKQSITVQKKHITPINDGIVLLSATGFTTATLSDGRTFKASFSWSFVYEKIDNKWMVVQSHQSSSRI